MTLIKHRIGEFVTLFSQKCNIPDLTCNDVSGVNSSKEFFEPSTQVGKDTSSYKIVPPKCFACNLMHVGRDCVLPIALNTSDDNKIVSPAYTTFSFDGKDILLIEYFFMKLKCEELDRYFWFNTDGSVRDGMSWSDFCDVELELPSVDIQQKYVNIYNSMAANQKSYEKGLEDLKLVCDATIEAIRRKTPCEKIGNYIAQSDRRNDIGLSKEDVRGIATSKELIPTKAAMVGVNVSNYKIVAPQQIAYVPDTSRRGDKISLAMNTEENPVLVSSISCVFSVNESKLLPEYLMLFFTRPEFDRYTRFHSWGSARETFTWDEMQNVEMPIPDLNTQRSITSIYKAKAERAAINNRLKEQLKELCPILINGSLKEAREK